MVGKMVIQLMKLEKLWIESTQDIENIYKNFERKRKTTEYLRMRPIF